MKKKIFRLLPILTILVACAIFFYPTFRYGKIPAPTDTLIGLYHPWLDQAATTNPAGVPFKNFLITDPIRQQIPWRKLVIDQWKEGAFPSWNPNNFSGTPLAANIQAGSFYPLNILFFFLPFSVAWATLIIIQPVLAAFFLYLYLRSKKILPAVAVFGGIAWAFCGFSIAWLTWGTILQTALWLPVMLLAIDKILVEQNKKANIQWTVLLATITAVSFFAGHAQVALYAILLAALYGLFAVWVSPHRGNWKWLLAAAAIAGVFSSVQWVPMVQFISHSSRIVDTAAWLKDGWFLPWQNLVQFIVPDFFGNPATLNYWGIWNYGEFIGYIGMLPLLFAMFAIISRRDRLTRFFTVAVVGAFLFLLPTAIAKLLFQLNIPILSALQPTRLMVLVDICLVILAALGLDAYFKNPNKKVLFGVFLMGAILAGLWIYVFQGSEGTDVAVSKRNLILPSALWAVSSVLLTLPLIFKKARNTLFVVLVLFVTMFDLFRFGWKFTPFTPVKYFFPQTPAISFLQSQDKPFRVMSLDNRILPPNVHAYYGIESIEGYDPIYDARYEEFIAALNRREPNIASPFGFNRIITSPTLDSPLLPLLNVKYILTLEELNRPDVELMYREGNTRIYWYKKGLPRIYPVETVTYVPSKQEMMSLMYDKAFHPDKTALVEEPLVIPPNPLVTADTIRLTSYAGSTLTAASSLKEDHFVVIANIYDGTWKATVDASVVPVYRTNYLFMGILVPKGDHTIKLIHD